MIGAIAASVEDAITEALMRASLSTSDRLAILDRVRAAVAGADALSIITGVGA